MWTPRRVLLLVAGLAGFVAAYVGYARVLGWMDGLPPLAAEYLERIDPADFPPLPTPAEKPVDARLRQAFGPNCAETGYTIKVDLTSRGLVLAADTYEILPEDGRVMLMPFSLAVYQSKDGPTPEVSAIHCDKAFITFEQPIRQPADMGKYRIVAAEFTSTPDLGSPDPRRGTVWLSNNRRSAAPEDDVVLRTRGPIFFHEEGRKDPGVDKPALERPNIWTREPILLEDKQNKPKPTTVSAHGMNVYLQPTEKGKKPDAKDAKEKGGPPNSGGSGVRLIELCSNVRMDLWVGSSGFMANSAKPTASPDEKVRLEITTLGPFRYDVPTDKARFEILPARDANPGLPNQVVAHRHSRNGANDQLFCDVLDVQFRRRSDVKSEAKAEPKASGSVELEIDEAHATGKYVAVASDAEDLSAYGTDLRYNSKDKRTVLVGSPWMVASKDGHEIRAPELVLTNVEPPAKDKGTPPKSDAKGIQASAPGPGEIFLMDRQTGRKPMRARWTDRLTFTKEIVDGQPVDVIILNGSAVFEDRDHEQSLAADTLKVWMEPDAPPVVTPAGAKPPPKPQGGRKPSRLQATGHVVMRAPEMHIHDTDLLVAWFRDAEPTTAVTPAITPKAAPTIIPVAAKTDVKPSNPTTQPPNHPTTPPAPPAEPKIPIDLSAQAVETFVLRRGGKNELDRVICEGRVRVHQDAPKPKDPTKPRARATDIRGQTLRLTHLGDGHILDVTDAPNEPAEVHLDKLSLIGPEIHIDQPANRAQVRGAGTMRMMSASDLNGRALKEAKPLTVTWQKSMDFVGKHALFAEAVTAEQDQSRLLCEHMDVTFDRTVSLNPERKRADSEGGEEPARVSMVVCHTGSEPGVSQVTAEDRVVDEKTKQLRLQRIVAPELIYHNDKSETDGSDSGVETTGPGIVSLLQPGAKEDGTKPAGKRPVVKQPAKPEPAAKAPEMVMKLTRVEYGGKMLASNQRRYAAFYDNVRVLHLPTDNINAVVDIDDPKKMPEGAMYLTSTILKVYHTPGDGKENQMLEASKNAWVQTREFYGRADVIKYNEASNQVIFEGVPGRDAVLYKMKPEGGEPDKMEGRKITYKRNDNSFAVENVAGATFGTK